ncbi:MAG: hypothetical protein WAW41_00250, partial [Methylobacter sp.]
MQKPGMIPSALAHPRRCALPFENLFCPCNYRTKPRQKMQLTLYKQDREFNLFKQYAVLPINLKTAVSPRKARKT